MKPVFFFCCTVVFLFPGCIQTIAVRSVGGIVEQGFEAITEEQDLDFAEKAIPANLKLLEVMLKSDPENVRILLLLSQGYSSYALGFIEDVDVDRARMFYRRGWDFGLRVLRQDRSMAQALDGSVDDLKAELARRSKDDVPAVFWTAFGIGSYINLTKTDPDALIELPRSQAMMEFVLSKDSSFYFGGAHLFLGMVYGSRPPMLGGNPDLAKRHFEEALAINKGKFLMTYVYYAQSYAVQTQNETLFEELLTQVQNTSLEILPAFRLANAIAQKKAKLLLARKSEKF